MAFDIQSLLQQLQDQYKAANTAGLERYQNLMRGVNGMGYKINDTFTKAEQGLEGMGATERARINENQIKGAASADQGLISRGLGNTTVRSSVQRGVASDADKARGALAEQVAGAKTNLGLARANSQLQVGRTWADAVLSRNDQGPDAGLYSNLIQSLAANGGLGGGAGGAGSGGGSGGGRSYNFVGGVPGSISFPNSVGPESQGGVQTFTNPNAVPGQTFRAARGATVPQEMSSGVVWNGRLWYPGQTLA